MKGTSSTSNCGLTSLVVGSTCKACKLSGKRKLCLHLQDLLYTQGGLPPALKGSDRICSFCGYDRKK